MSTIVYVPRDATALALGAESVATAIAAEASRRKLDSPAIEARADHDDGIFGDHLRRMRFLLERDPQLCAAMRGFLQGQPLTNEQFYRLRSAGLIKGDSAGEARPRCELYARYLRKHLL